MKSYVSIYDFMPTLKVDESIFTSIFCQNASVWNRLQLYIDDKGKLWVTNTKKLDTDTNILNKQKK